MNPPPLPSQFPPPLPPRVPRVVAVGTPAPRRRSVFSRVLTVLVRTVIVLAVAFVALLVYRVWQFKQYSDSHPTPKPPGEEELHQAMGQIITSQHGNAHGNTPEAQALAKQVSDQMKAIRESSFTGGKDAGSVEMLTLTNGNFLVYCQLNPDSCAFLIHAPELRHYTASAKQSLAQAAWVAATKALDSAPRRGGRKLAVATRGEFFFDQILSGEYRLQENNPLGRPASVSAEGMYPASLQPFFAPPRTGSPAPVP